MMNNMKNGVILLTALSLIFLPSCLPIDSTGPFGPEQPASGPGGSAYAHQTITKNVYGENETQYWIYEPADPVPASAPVIVFLHGWNGLNPAYYGAWLKHLVLRGNIVIFPLYQLRGQRDMSGFPANAASAVTAALATLNDAGHVKPDLDRFAFVGHSVGALLAPSLAALADSQGWPRPKAVMALEPPGPGSRDGAVDNYGLPVPDLSKIPADTLFLAVAGDQDEIVGTDGAIWMIRNTPQISPDNKDYVLMVSDDHGTPALVADHRVPTIADDEFDDGDYDIIDWLFARRARRRPAPDALNFYGHWKLFDALTDAAFYGTNRQYALGNTPEQRNMGFWSDNTPVRELIVTNAP
jgi:acetyl esterase/lipase